MAVCPNDSGLLTISGMDTETEAWTVLNPYTPLWTVGQLIESDPVHIGGSSGSVVFAPEIDGFEWDMQLVVIGENDPDGVLFNDPWVGLESNINVLRTGFLDPIPTNNGLRPSVLHMPSGATRTADVLVRKVAPGEVSVGSNGSCSDEGSTAYSVFARYVVTLFIATGLFV